MSALRSDTSDRWCDIYIYIIQYVFIYIYRRYITTKKKKHKKGLWCYLLFGVGTVVNIL